MVHIERCVRFDRLVLRHRHHASGARNRQGRHFVTLQDEIGSVNFIVWRHIRERRRLALLRSRLLAVARRQRAKDGGTYLIARRLVDVCRG